MLKTGLKRLATVLMVLLLIYGAGRFADVYSGSFYQGERAPYLMMPAPDALTLRWQTAQPGRGQVRYGLTPQSLPWQASEARVGEAHELRLRNLKPDTRYYYQIENRRGSNRQVLYTGVDYHFTTPPPIGQAVPLRFAVLGDPGQRGPVQSAVRDALLEWLAAHPRAGRPRLDLLLTTGDNAYRSGSNKQFQKGFFTPYAAILRNTPVWPVYGNHDARRWAFFDIFRFPAKGESGGLPSGSRHYYAFDYANAHFVMLDSQDSRLHPGSAMLDWLARDLAATRQPWIIAAFHHPPYSHGSHNSDDRGDSGGRMAAMREHVLPLLEAAGADLVLSGHSHMYERSYLLRCHYGDSGSLRPWMIMDKSPGAPAPYRKPGRDGHAGTVYAVVGSSAKVNQGSLDHPAMAVSLAEAGSLLVDIDHDRMTAHFIRKDGRIADRFVIRKLPGTGGKSSCEAP